MTDPPLARVLHEGRGRVRLRLERRAPEQIFEVANALARCPGVLGVSPRPLTGSLVVQHTGPLATLASSARDRGILEIEWEAPKERSNVLGDIHDEIAAIDHQIRERSGGRVGLDTVGFYALLAATGLQVRRGDILPAGAALFISALAMLSKNVARVPPGPTA